MKTLRTTLAAAAVAVLPLAATLASTPAAAQTHAVVASAAIRSIALNSNAGLAPGAVLRVDVHGTPGARNASVTLGTSGVRVPLREASPGHYVGSHVVRRGERIDPQQRLTARVRFGSTTVAQSFRYPPAFQALAMGAARPDRTPPRVTTLAPSKGARIDEHGRTTLSGRLSDDRSGVNPASVRLRVDGLDVTADARITQGDFTYRERLGRGRHSAEVLVRDHAGNATRTAWTFQVV